MNLKFCAVFLAAVLLGGCDEKAPEVPVPEPTALQEVLPSGAPATVVGNNG